jgi:glycosyltransferase involved in cell wall biosynthesis
MEVVDYGFTAAVCDKIFGNFEECDMAAQLTAPVRARRERIQDPSAAHVVFLTNFIPPYQLPVLEEFAQRVRKLTVLISTPMEPNRSWNADWGHLNVEVQRNFSWRRNWRYAGGFTEDNFIHVPWDTIFRLKALAPDVVISGQLGMRSVLSAFYRRLFKRTRLVFLLGLSQHTETGRSASRTLVRKRLLRQCDSVVVNGRSGVRYVESLGIEPSRIYRCPYTTNSLFFEKGSSARSPETAQRLLYMGRFVELKGVVPFLQVLRTWGESHPDRNVELDFVGNGPLEKTYAEFEMPRNIRLRFRGRLEYEELPAAYREGGILVMPTLADEWGLGVNEALASGLPVFGSLHSQAVEDLCTDGVNGWTYKPDVGNEMADALERALATPMDQLNVMRQAARDSVASVTAQTAAAIWYQAVEHALAAR